MGDMYCTIGNLRAHYVTDGTGPTVLFLHGWGADISAYRQVIDFLKKDWCVCSLDLPGFGCSEEPPEPWDVDHYVDFVQDFMTETHLDRVVLFGHSFGGRIVIKLVNRSDISAKVTKIVLMDAAGIKNRKSLKQKVRERLYKIMKFVFQNPVMKFLYPTFPENMRRKFGSEDYLAASPMMRATLVKTVNEDLSAFLPGMHIPTLLLWGEKDTATPLWQGQFMHRMIPDSKLVIIKNAGHFPFQTDFATVSDALQAYLNVSGE